MFNATELTLTTKSIVEDGVALEYVGPLTEVTLWRDTRDNRMQHAQPGEYIVKDRDGYPRQYSAVDFAVLFEAAPVPTNITSLTKSTTDDTSIVMTWTDVVAGTDKINIYKNGVYLAQVNHGVQTYTATGLDPDTAYTFTARTVNSYGVLGALASGTTLTDAYTLPVAPDNLVATAVAATAVLLEWTPSATDLTSDIQPYTDGVAFGSALPAGSDHVVVTGLTTATQYAFTIKAIGAVSTLASAASPTATETTD